MSSNRDHGGNILTVARQMGLTPDQLTDFSASINPLGISEAVREALIGSIDSLVHYPDNSHQPLKQALGRYHGLAPDCLLITNGSTEMIYQLPPFLRGSRALVISPSFSEYTKSLALAGWQIRHFLLSSENDFAIDLEALEKSLAEDFDALYLCTPGNPSATLYDRHTIAHIYNLCLASGTFLVLDEAFMDFCERQSAKEMVVRGGQAVILRSMTKFFAIPGLRLGYAIADPRLIQRLESMACPWSVNTLAQKAGEAALADRDFIEATLEYVSKERDFFGQQLTDLELKVYPSVANYLLVKLKEGLTAGELKERLLRQRILIRDCSSFEGLSERFIRLAVRTRAENELLLDALRGLLT